MLSVHFLENLSPEFELPLREQLEPSIKLTTGESLPENPDHHILIAGVPEEQQLDASPNLTTLIIPWAGLPVCTREYMLKRPHISVHNLHYNASMVAESAATHMLTAAKRYIPADRNLRRGDWTIRYQPHRSVLLSGKTALIVGYGAIGRHLARICRGFGMTVLGTRRNPAECDKPDAEIFYPTWLHRLLPRANVLFVAVPLTPETKDLLGEYELSLLPDHAIVINIARGPIINEHALYNELKSGRISAGLDVWYNYPRTIEARHDTLPSNYPFHKLDNVVMTPHMAEHGLETENHQVRELARMLNLAASGAELPNRVTPDRGY